MTAAQPSISITSKNFGFFASTTAVFVFGHPGVQLVALRRVTYGDSAHRFYYTFESAFEVSGNFRDSYAARYMYDAEQRKLQDCSLA